ncbi:unnamed protein product [Aphanomyces euteiches]|nr:hypothetical protein AeRB84_018608 [Aphanomyces euteiches]
MEHEANWVLEGDGLVENLFYYLWCKDEFGGGPSLLIPDTVVYKFTQPAYWYFTSKSGKVKKKSKTSLTNVMIEKEFCRKACGVDIVAYYIYMLNDVPTIEYFTVDGLKDFLYSRQKIHNGILQRFIVPKGSANSMIRAIWTPKMCLLERKTNIRRLHDLRYGLYERAVTFDGADAYSNPDPVRGSVLPGDIQYLCEQVVDHVMEVSFHKYRISRMVLHIKTDAEDKVWLLWSSSIRLAHPSRSHNSNAMNSASLGHHKPVDITSDAQVPAFVHLNCMPDSKPKANQPKVFAKCHSCAKSIDSSTTSAVPYKAILEHFRHLLHHMKQDTKPGAAVLWPPDPAIIRAAGNVGFGILNELDDDEGGGPRKPITEIDVMVPPVLRYLHPNLSLADFKRFVHDPVFLYKTTTVCDDCFLVYADYATSALDVNTLRQEAPAILRPLREIPPLKQINRVKHPDAAWMPTGSVPKSTRPPMTNMTKSQYSFKQPPTMPSRIDHTVFDDVARQLPVELRYSSSTPTLSIQEEVTASATLGRFLPDAWKQPPSMAPNPLVSNNVKATKENSFFSELSASSMTLETHHPLRHMVESASQLASSTSMPQLKTEKKARNPYTVVQTLLDDEKPKKVKLRPKKKLAFQKLAHTSEEEQVTSMQHREFLLNALHEVQRQLDNPDTLEDVLREDAPNANKSFKDARKAQVTVSNPPTKQATPPVLNETTTEALISARRKSISRESMDKGMSPREESVLDQLDDLSTPRSERQATANDALRRGTPRLAANDPSALQDTNEEGHPSIGSARTITPRNAQMQDTTSPRSSRNGMDSNRAEGPPTPRGENTPEEYATSPRTSEHSPRPDSRPTEGNKSSRPHTSSDGKPASPVVTPRGILSAPPHRTQSTTDHSSPRESTTSDNDAALPVRSASKPNSARSANDEANTNLFNDKDVAVDAMVPSPRGNSTVEEAAAILAMTELPSDDSNDVYHLSDDEDDRTQLDISQELTPDVPPRRDLNVSRESSSHDAAATDGLHL